MNHRPENNFAGEKERERETSSFSRSDFNSSSPAMLLSSLTLEESADHHHRSPTVLPSLTYDELKDYSSNLKDHRAPIPALERLSPDLENGESFREGIRSLSPEGGELPTLAHAACTPFPRQVNRCRRNNFSWRNNSAGYSR